MRNILSIFLLLFAVNLQAQVMIVGGSSAQGNTDHQQLSLVGNVLSIDNGATTIDLSGYLDNTDGQTITDFSLAGNILSITLSGGNTDTVDLSAIAGGGVSDHGGLTGLADDDHTQYHNDARAAAWLAALYANLDTDSTDDVTLDGALQIITSPINFTGAIQLPSAVYVQKDAVGSYSEIRFDIGAASRYLQATGSDLTYDTKTLFDGILYGDLSLNLISPRIIDLGLNEQSLQIKAGTALIASFHTEFTTIPALAFDNTGTSLTSALVEDAIIELDTNDASLITSISTNAADIAALETALSNPTTSTFTIDNEAIAFNFVIGDAQDGVIKELGADGTLNTSIFSQGHSLRINYPQGGVGDKHIIEGTNVSILGYDDGITLSAYPSGVTLTRSNSTSPELWKVTDLFGTVADYSSTLPHPNDSNGNPELVTGSAASFPPDETSSSHTMVNIFEVTNVAVADTSNGYGDYVQETESTGDGSLDRTQFTVAVTSGVTYNWALAYRMVQGNSGRIRSNSGFVTEVNQQSLASTTWTVISGTIEADVTGNSVWEVMPAHAGALGDKIQWKFSMEAQ